MVKNSEKQQFPENSKILICGNELPSKDNNKIGEILHRAFFPLLDEFDENPLSYIKEQIHSLIYHIYVDVNSDYRDLLCDEICAIQGVYKLFSNQEFVDLINQILANKSTTPIHPDTLARITVLEQLNSEYILRESSLRGDLKYANEEIARLNQKVETLNREIGAMETTISTLQLQSNGNTK